MTELTYEEWLEETDAIILSEIDAMIAEHESDSEAYLIGCGLIK